MANPWLGRTIGNYVLRSVIGRGGMGIVFSGEHRFLGEPVAVKVLLGTFARHAATSQRFFQEAKSTRSIEHPNVIKIYDFGQAEEDGALYLGMELLEGESLAHRIARHGPLPEEMVARIGWAVADGLHAAHLKGVIHRDMKPGNIFLCSDGRIKVLDFGIAKLQKMHLTATGAVVGTPKYMAPEQASKKSAIGPPTDVYGLAVTLFKALTGRLPFIAEDVASMIARHLYEPPPRPSQFAPVSPRMDALLLACLEKDPARRPQTMAELRDRFFEFLPEAARRDRTRLSRIDPSLLPRGRGEGSSDSLRMLDDEDEELLGGEPALQPDGTPSGSDGSVSLAGRANRLPIFWKLSLVAASVLLLLGGGVVALLLLRPPAPAAIPDLGSAIGAGPDMAGAEGRKEIVEFSTSPPGAKVSLEDEVLGTTPVELELRLPQEVTISLAGYETVREQVRRPGLVRLILKKTRSASRPSSLPAPPPITPTAAPTPPETPKPKHREGLE